MTTLQRRTTKYSQKVHGIIKELGHGTNAEIAEVLRREYPSVSDTTVHRITQRLLEDGNIRLAPNAADGSLRFDSNLNDHDHFVCNACGNLRDLIVPQSCRALIQYELGNCKVSGGLVISGGCHTCLR